MLEIKVKEFLCSETLKKISVYVSHKLLRVTGLMRRDRAEVKEAMPKKSTIDSNKRGLHEYAYTWIKRKNTV